MVMNMVDLLQKETVADHNEEEASLCLTLPFSLCKFSDGNGLLSFYQYHCSSEIVVWREFHPWMAMEGGWGLYFVYELSRYVAVDVSIVVVI